MREDTLFLGTNADREEVVDILTAISVVSKRLAVNLVKAREKLVLTKENY